MSTFVLVAVAVFCGCIVMLSQIKKGCLSELEKALNLKDFVMKGFLGEAKLNAVWKDMPFSIEALPQFTIKPSDIKYSVNYNSGYLATITAGAGLQSGGAAKKVSEEETARPWRAKLTAEEQRIISSRHGSSETEKSVDKFNIVSNKPDEVSRFLKNEKRVEAVENLLKSGITAVRIDVDKIVAVKTGYSNSDMAPKQVEKYLTELKKLIS